MVSSNPTNMVPSCFRKLRRTCPPEEAHLTRVVRITSGVRRREQQRRACAHIGHRLILDELPQRFYTTED
jgi:hypothetical protein